MPTRKNVDSITRVNSFSYAPISREGLKSLTLKPHIKKSLYRKLTSSFLIFAMLFQIIGGIFCVPTQRAQAAPASPDSDLANWRTDPYPLAPTNIVGGATFGNVVYDPVNSIWRSFYHSGASAGTGTIYQETGSTPRAFDSPVLALGYGTAGTWDEKQTGVPYAWYEAGQTRPWRMIYRGCPVSGACQIGLATSLDGINWDRKDTNGNILTAPVIKKGSSGWDNGSIDFGSVIKVGLTYYIYYDTIGAPRKTGLATSTDLVNWTKDSNNPLFTGVADYSDKNYNGTVDLLADFFCPDVVFWPRNDGSSRYVMFIPHSIPLGGKNNVDIYVSDTPSFAQENRTYIGKAFRLDVNPPKIAGHVLNTVDTPRIITDDITRNVVASTGTGSDVYMVLAATNSDIGWNEIMLVYNKVLNETVLDNISADPPLPPSFGLSPAGSDANTVALWLPGLTGTLRDMTGGLLSLSGRYSQINSKGVKLTAANNEFVGFGYNVNGITELDKVNAITGDFSLEATVTPTTMAYFTEGFRGILSCSGKSSGYHFYWLVKWISGSTYSMYLVVTSGGSSQTYTSPPITLSDNVSTRLTITRSGGNIYAFQDGTLLNSGGSAFNWTIDSTPDLVLRIGANNSGKMYFWDGWIDEIRISNTARWTANYTPAPLSYIYQPSGTIFTKVYDFGDTNQPTTLNPIVTTPVGTSVVSKVRGATSLTDQSSAIGDFSILPQSGIATRYQQFALSLTTTDPTQSPTVSSVNIQNVPLPQLAQVAAVPSYTNTITPSYTFSSDQPGTISYGGDCSSTNTNAIVGNNTVTFTSLSQGAHSNCTITVTNNGYLSAPLNVNSFLIDTTPSTHFTLVSPSVGAIISDKNPTFSWNPSFDSGSDVSKYQLYIDGVMDKDNIAGNVTSIFANTELSCDNHSWYMKAFDGAGNVTDSDTFSLKINCGSGFVSPAKPNVSSANVTIDNGNLNLTNLPTTITQIAISTSPDFTDASWEDISKKDDLLKQYDNTDTLYIKFRTQEGGVSDTIIKEGNNITGNEQGTPSDNVNDNNIDTNNSNQSLQDGDLIKIPNNPDIYVIKYKNNKQYKRLLLTPTIFNSYLHLKWNNIKTISQQQLDQYQTSNLVKETLDTIIYQLFPDNDTGKRKPLNPSTSYDPDSIYEINKPERDSYELED